MSDNPFESTLSVSRHPRKKTWGGFFAKLFLIGLALFFVMALLLPGFSRGRYARSAARRAGCINNMRQVGLAILNYESANGELPPAYTVDDDGNRLHSWRTLILPYIEEGDLYDSIDLTKSWDDPANAHAREATISPYRCPASELDDSQTTYLAVVGPDRAFSGSEARKWTDAAEAGSSNTLMLVEMPSDKSVHWMSPYDTDLGGLSELNEDSEANHDEMLTTCFLDNHTQMVYLGDMEDFLECVREFKGFEDL